MSGIYGILPQSNSSDNNLAASIKQWTMTQLITPYNTAAIAQGINNGVQLESDGSWQDDGAGLVIIFAEPTDRSFYAHVPVVAYNLDYNGAKAPSATGMGDDANWEWRSLSMSFLPALLKGGDDQLQGDIKSYFLLKSLAVNTWLRTHTIPIVDSTNIVGNVAPQIGYANLYNQKLTKFNSIKDQSDPNYLRFDITLDIRWAVVATNY